MRNIKLTESEWKYLCDALLCSDFPDSWPNEGIKFGTKEWDRKNELLKRAEYKFVNAKKEVA
tara:strand:+ start:1466 stop:1651 length:186 start_codon:yes stop_codon:yes gene_type:complete